jgi:monothiol glutaredoxin
MSLEPEVRQVIDELLADNRVILFMKGNRTQPQCGFSAKAVAALDMLVPDYATIDVLQHPEIREGIKAYGNWPTIPQLYVAGELLGGSDIITGMFESGELADALGVAIPAADGVRVEITPAAAAIMEAALRDHPGTAVHLKIDAGFGHALSLTPPKPGSVEIAAGPLTLRADALSAGRAHGLRIDVRESLQGQGFDFQNPQAPPPVKPLAVTELKAALAGTTPPHLYDVRGDDERAVAAIAAARPWDDAALREIDGLAKDAPLAFMCHRGSRSRNVAERYRRQGYTNVFNVEGGIDAWSLQVDPAIPRY